MRKQVIRRLLCRGFITLSFTTGCASSHFGTFPDRLADFPDRRISPADDAVQPYLAQTFQQLRADRKSDWPDPVKSPPQTRVKLQGKYYYVLKDNYP